MEEVRNSQREVDALTRIGLQKADSLEKLEADNVIKDARVAAEHSIWEIFQPVISNLSSKYTLKVEFKGIDK